MQCILPPCWQTGFTFLSKEAPGSCWTVLHRSGVNIALCRVPPNSYPNCPNIVIWKGEGGKLFVMQPSLSFPVNTNLVSRAMCLNVLMLHSERILIKNLGSTVG